MTKEQQIIVLAKAILELRSAINILRMQGSGGLSTEMYLAIREIVGEEDK